MASNNPPAPSSEGPPTTYFWTRTDRSTPTLFPHFSHDLNTLSTTSINAAAFIPSPSIGVSDPLTSLITSEDIAEAYEDILSDVDDPTPTLDFDRFGILFEFGEMYFVVMKDAAARSMGVTRGFIEKEHVGAHLVAEWASLPKERVGRCVVASGTGGWWHVRSKVLEEVREEVASRVKLTDRAMMTGRGRGEEEEGIRTRLREEVAVVVDRVYQRIEKEEGEERKGEEVQMGEWLDWDVRGKQDVEERVGEEYAMQENDILENQANTGVEDAME
ncbi:hypothetical protein HBI47_114140 [Parastagonospora nodorum]|nr:hypothetical protein HBI47_114140 [Parastagonospora nodorum]